MIETLMEEIKPKVIEEYEIDCPGKSEIISFFAVLHYQDFNAKKKIDYFSV